MSQIRPLLIYGPCLGQRPSRRPGSLGVRVPRSTQTCSASLFLILHQSQEERHPWATDKLGSASLRPPRYSSCCLQAA